MKTNKNLIIVTFIITISSFGVCFITRSEKPFIYDLSMAIFGSSIIGLVVAYLSYSVVKRESMESFWLEGIKLIDKVRDIKYLYFDIPIDLIKDYLHYDGITGYFYDVEFKEACEEIKEWIEINKYPNNCSENYNQELEDEFNSTIASIKKRIIEVAQSYIDFAELDILCFSNSFWAMDFLFSNRIIRQKTLNNMHITIDDFHKKCCIESFHFRRMIKGIGNYEVCLEKLLELNGNLFTERDGLIYATFADDLNYNLELFRAKIYDIVPKSIDTIPINQYNYFGE